MSNPNDLEALCSRAHYLTSHTPDQRGKQYASEFMATRGTVAAQGGDPEKLEKLFRAWMASKSRCASPMITGPANFPTRRNQKANAVERKRGQAYFEYVEAVAKRHAQETYYAANPTARPISADDEDALPRLREKLAKLQADHEALRLKPNKAWYEMPYSRNAIKRVEARIAQMEAAATRQHIEIQKDGFKVIQNVEANRIQIAFEGKPDAETIALLKQLAFKWAPSIKVWQRQLTNAGIYAAKTFMAKKAGQEA